MFSHPRPRPSFRHRTGRIALFLLKLTVVLLVFSGAVMLLWNHLVPAVFHLPRLGYVQALELTLLSRILCGWRMLPRRRFRYHGGEGHPHRWGCEPIRESGRENVAR